MLDAHLARSRTRIERAGLVEETLVDRARAVVDGAAPPFARVISTRFLDDTTTKHVIIDRGQLSGIVDGDALCFDDPPCTPALTRMALPAGGHDTASVDA